MVHQNFNRDVAAVYNTENMYIGGAGFASSAIRLPPKGWMALALLNRQRQLDAITDRIDNILQQNAGGTLVVVLRGVQSDFAQNLVYRCGFGHFSERFECEAGWRYLGRLRWPSNERGITPIIKEISELLGVPKDAKTQAAIETELGKIRKNICFSHHVDITSCRGGYGRLVLDWIHYVATSWPRVPGHLVVFFLCLNINTGMLQKFSGAIRRRLTGHDNQFDQWLGAVEARFGDDPASPILITDPLRPIDENDFGEWVSEVGRFLNEPTLEVQLPRYATKLFPSPGVRRTFEEVHTELAQVLADLLGAGPTFVRTI